MKKLILSFLIFCFAITLQAQDSVKNFLEEMVYPEFVRCEATYQNQTVILPRSSVAQPLTLGSQIHQIFEKAPVFTDAYVCVGSSWGSGIKDTLYVNPQTLFDTDPIMLAYGVNNDGTLFRKYNEPNVTINLGYNADDGSKRYMTIFMRVRGFLNRALYARMTVMFPGKETDDLSTYQSPSKPFVGSYVTAFDANPANVAEDMKYYNAVDSTLRVKIKSKESLSDIEYTLIEGMYETSIFSSSDEDYAMSMYNDKRYSDAYQFFEKTYLSRRAKILAGDNEDESLYYRACYYMGECLNKLGVNDKAKYFLGLAALIGGDYAQTYSHLQNAQVSQRDLHNYQYIDENKCDLNSVTVGQTLYNIYDIIPENILGGRVKVNDNVATNALTSKESWDLDLKSLCTDKPSVLVLQYSKEQSETHSTVDMSKFLYANSVIITVHKVSSNPGLWRVNIMIPNFRNDDDKKGHTELNEPLMSSFVISNENAQWNLKNYQSIYDECKSLINNHRSAEALTGLKLVYSSLAKKYEGKKMPSAQQELYKSAGFYYGYCLIELDAPYKAIYYLQPNAEVGGPREKQEYINALCHIQDVRVMSIIDEEIKNSTLFLKKHPQDEEYKKYRRFILRRKGYVLIDQKKYDEAEALFKTQKDTEKDPEILKHIENELKYIQQQRNKK